MLQAVSDLAGRLAVPLDAIVVHSVTAVAWRDASLGLARPGFVYAQVITPGYRIELEASGARYRYHADMQRVLFAGAV